LDSPTHSLEAEIDELEREEALAERIGEWLLETDVEYDGDISTCQTCGQYWDGILYDACPSCGGYLG
jgi:rubrerythrin